LKNIVERRISILCCSYEYYLINKNILAQLLRNIDNKLVKKYENFKDLFDNIFNLERDSPLNFTEPLNYCLLPGWK